MTSIYRQYFILGGEFLHHGEEKEKKHQIFGHIVPSFFPQKITWKEGKFWFLKKYSHFSKSLLSICSFLDETLDSFL